MIGVIDYGLGNVGAFLNIFGDANIDAIAVREASQLTDVDRIILPGVGAFDWAMSRLNCSGLRDSLDRAVLTEKKPVLGVCVGMQMMGDSSEEGRETGLGWIRGAVRRLPGDRGPDGRLPLPHMGWNDVAIDSACSLLAGLDAGARFYFLHSYYFEPENQAATLATTEYGVKFSSAVRSFNAFGVQFHPEKSHGWGIRLLQNFAAT